MSDENHYSSDEVVYIFPITGGGGNSPFPCRDPTVVYPWFEVVEFDPAAELLLDACDVYHS